MQLGVDLRARVDLSYTRFRDYMAGRKDQVSAHDVACANVVAIVSCDARPDHNEPFAGEASHLTTSAESKDRRAISVRACDMTARAIGAGRGLLRPWRGILQSAVSAFSRKLHHCGA
jgi:hypothetical protein